MRKFLWIFHVYVLLTSNLSAERDYTEEFQLYYEHPPATLISKKLAKDVHFIFIPGLIDSVKRSFLSKVVDYTDYKDYEHWIKAHHSSSETLLLFSQRAPHQNYELVESAIMEHAGNKPVFIIGHSYGGLYALSTLLDHPHLIPHVAALVTIQTPFYGSHIVESFDNTKALSFFMRNIAFPVMNGTEEGFHELTYKHRTEWTKQNQSQIESLAKQIPIFNLMSNYKGRFNVFSGLSRFFYNYEDSDGLVEVSSQRLKFGNIRYAFLENWSHTDTITSQWGERTAEERHRLFEALIVSVLGSR